MKNQSKGNEFVPDQDEEIAHITPYQSLSSAQEITVPGDDIKRPDFGIKLIKTQQGGDPFEKKMEAPIPILSPQASSDGNILIIEHPD